MPAVTSTSSVSPTRRPQPSATERPAAEATGEPRVSLPSHGLLPFQHEWRLWACWPPSWFPFNPTTFGPWNLKIQDEKLHPHSSPTLPTTYCVLFCFFFFCNILSRNLEAALCCGKIPSLGIRQNWLPIALCLLLINQETWVYFLTSLSLTFLICNT